MAKKYPKGWDDEKINQLGIDLAGQIDAYNASVTEDKETWTRVMDVYNDNPDCVLTSMEWPDGVKRAYNVPLIQTRSDALVDDVSAAILSASPMFVNRARVDDQIVYTNDGQSLFVEGEQTREDQEQTVDFALRRAGFERKLKDSLYSAVLKGRGVMRMTYQTVKIDNLDDASPIGVNDQGGGEIQYSGIKLDTVLLEHFVGYPTYCQDVLDLQTMGHWFPQRIHTIENKIARGEYFDVEVMGSDTAVPTDKDKEGGKDCYELLTKIKEDGVERWYKVTLLFQQQKVLNLERYTLPRPWYFLPGVKLEPNAIVPKRSIAAKALEMQTLANDLLTSAVVGSMATSMPSQLVAGAKLDQSNVKIGLGEVIFTDKSPTSVTNLSGRYDPGVLLPIMQYIERECDSIFRVSAASVGQSPDPEVTATAENIAAQGTQRGYTAYIGTLAVDLEPMAEFAKFLIAENYEDFKAFYGGAVHCKSKEDLQNPSFFELNSKSINVSPSATIAKVEKAVQAAIALGVQIDPNKAYEVILNALDLGVSIKKLEPPQMGGGPEDELAAALQVTGMGGGQGLPPGEAGGQPGGGQELAVA